MKAPLDESALHPQARRAVRRATELHWTVCGYQSRSSARGVNLISPPPHRKQITVPPVRQWNRGKMRTLMATIERYGTR